MVRGPAETGATRRPVSWRWLSIPALLALVVGVDLAIVALGHVHGGPAYVALLIMPVLPAAIVGLAPEHVVRAAGRETAVAEDRAELLDRLVATHTAIATSDIGLDDLL